MNRITLVELNGNEIDKSVRCQFCGREMKQGTAHMGSGINTLTYWCECGANALFSHLYGKRIKRIESKYEFEER